MRCGRGMAARSVHARVPRHRPTGRSPRWPAMPASPRLDRRPLASRTDAARIDVWQRSNHGDASVRPSGSDASGTRGLPAAGAASRSSSSRESERERPACALLASCRPVADHPGTGGPDHRARGVRRWGRTPPQPCRVHRAKLALRPVDGIRAGGVPQVGSPGRVRPGRGGGRRGVSDAEAAYRVS